MAKRRKECFFFFSQNHTNEFPRTSRYSKGLQVKWAGREWYEMHAELMVLTSEAVLPLAITAAFVSKGDHSSSHATWGYFMIVGVATQVFTGWIRTKGLKATHANFSGLHRVSEQGLRRVSVCREAVSVRSYPMLGRAIGLLPGLVRHPSTFALEREKVLVRSSILPLACIATIFPTRDGAVQQALPHLVWAFRIRLRRDSVLPWAGACLRRRRPHIFSG